MIPAACHPGSRRHAHTITSLECEALATPDMSFMTPMRTTPCAIAEPAASAHKAAGASMILHLKSPVHRKVTARAGANYR